MIRVVGTAGHVDHGKSALVEALTGMHPDRLREEQQRQMTIDLGFAWTTLPGGLEVGFIDVPGHRDFIDNMLAGAGGFDAALLVVAADEGVMPQTREHLAILDLLGIPQAVVALTKIDLVEEPGWPELVEGDVRRLLGATQLAQAPIVRVSARSGEGLDALRAELGRLLVEIPPVRDLGRPRLPVDRSFVMPGFGTVLTGTLLDGSLHVGQEVEVLPAGLRGRVRGLQTHRRSVETAVPGSRVAANLSGIDAAQVRRGDVVCLPGRLQATRNFDAEVRVLAEAPVGIRSGAELKLHVGAADVAARARTLGVDRIDPGTMGWVQLVLREEVVVAEGDRFILRRPTPGATLGGGQVVDAHPRRLHRRKDRTLLESLAKRRHGSDADRIAVLLAMQGALTTEEIARELDQDLEATAAALTDAVAGGLVKGFRGSGGSAEIFVEGQTWERLKGRAAAALDEFHAAYPLRLGMPRQELRSRLGLEGRALDRLLVALGLEAVAEAEGARVWRSGFAPRLDATQEASVAALRELFDRSPFSPPAIRECRAALGEELWALLVARGDYVVVAENVAFDRGTYARLAEEVTATLEAGRPVTVGLIRDRYSTSRRYALALLEHLDRVGLTVRVGDERRLRPGWEPPQKDGPAAG
jgi:selenocysteine-specific elongation factor